MALIVDHSREDWQDPAQPVRGPAPRGVVSHWVIHYAGGGYAPTAAQAPAYLRAVQNDYVTNRGYSIGYSYAVTLDGSSWELRGDTFNAASNPGKKANAEGLHDGNFNNVSQSIFVMNGSQNPLPQVCVDKINEIIAARPGRIVHGHRDVDYTQCPGDGTYAQIESGVIGYQPEPPPPPPTLPPEDTDMPVVRFTTTNRKGQFLIGAGLPVMLSAKMVAEEPFASVPRVVGDGPDEDARWDEYQRIYFAAQNQS